MATTSFSDSSTPASRRTPAWVVALAGPFLFLLINVLLSVGFGVIAQGDTSAIPQLVADTAPYQLVSIQVALLLALLLAMRRDGLAWRDLGWKVAGGQMVWREALIGVLPGAALGLLYVFALSPGLTWVQRTLGDYVPAGEVLPALGASLMPFFAANVLLAPFVEENIYRGYLLTRWLGKYRAPVAVALTCLVFGLLHWAGGFWYILLTGIVAGGLFAGLFTLRRNLVAPFAAHLALNLVEFLFTWLVL